MKNIYIILLLIGAFLAPKMQFAQQVVLKTDTISVPCTSTDTFLIPVSVQNFNNLGGIQFSLEWDFTKMKYIHIQDFNPLLENGFVGMDTTNFITNGQFTFSWLDPSGLTIPAAGNNVLFNVAVVRLGGSFSPLSFDTTALPYPPPTAVTVSNSNFNAVPFSLSTGGINTTDAILPTITCPAAVTVNGSGPVAIPAIAPTTADNCGITGTGWASTGATTNSAPTDNDASGAFFNVGQSIVTYKTTDFGGNTATCSFAVNVVFDPTLSDSLTFAVSSGTADCGSLFFVDVTTANFDSIFGAQFSLEWQTAVLHFDSVAQLNQDISLLENNINLLYAQNGNTPGAASLSFGWNSDDFAAGSSLDNGARLFRIYFTVVGAHGSASTVTFTNFPAAQLSIDPSLLPIPTKYISGGMSVDDNIAPVIKCPASQTVDAVLGQTTAVVTGLNPVQLTDNCSGNIALTYTPTTVGAGSGVGVANGTFPAGTTTVNYTATDLAGNSASCTFTVTVNLGEVFELQIDSVEAACGSTTVSIPFRVYNFDAIAGMNFRISWDETVLQYTGFSGVYPGMGINGASFPSSGVTAPTGLLNFLAVNPTGQWPNIPDGGIVFSLNFNILNQNATTNLVFEEPLNAIDGSFSPAPFLFSGGLFEVVDLSGPVVTCPTNQVVAGGANCTATVNNLTATATDQCGTVASITNNAPVGNVFPAGTTQVVFTATDNSGNTGTCAMSVVVTANTALQVQNCPTDTVEVNATVNCSAAINYPTITAINPCVSNANFSYNCNFPVGTVRPVGFTTVVCTATQLGNGGGQATCTFVVQVKDAAAPQMQCPSAITLNANGTDCFVVNPVLGTATVTDNCSTGLTAQIDADLIDTLFTGIHNLVYTSEDAAGNTASCTQNVTILEQSAPVLNCPASIELSAGPTCTAVAEWDKPTPTDNCTAPEAIILTSTFGSGDDFSVGVTAVTYFATDASGNQSTCSFDVVVIENVPPVLTPCPSSKFIILPTNKCDTVITWIPPTATDNCALDTIISNFIPGATFPSGVSEVLYIAIDEAGNRDSCSFLVSAIDGIAPVFVDFPADIVINNASPCGAILSIPEPTATDNCDPNPVISYAGSLQDTFPIGTTKIEIRVEDASGNTTLDTLIITVNAIQPKSFGNIPSNQVLYGCASVATWTEPTVQGFCEEPVLTSSHNSGDVFPVGTTTVVYKATEPNGSFITASFTITINDTIPPVFNCPGNATVSVAGAVVTDPGGMVANVAATTGCQSVTMTLKTPSATDNCDQVLTVVQTGGPASPGNFPAGVHTLTYKVTDSFGNTATCSYTVTVAAFTVAAPSIDPNPGCAGETVTVSVPAFPGATYSWTGPQSGYPNAAQITINTLSDVHVGDYAVTMSLNGCTASSGTTSLQLAGQPNAENDMEYSIGIGDTLHATSVLLNDAIPLPDDIIVTQKSDLNGLVFNSDGTFTFQSSTAGAFSFIYQVCSISCPDLCDMATVTIVVRDNNCSFVPNIFTPNGDMSNDYFEIPCLDSGLYPNNSLVIYNQWGDKVFEADGYDNSAAKAWKGTLNNEDGKDLPDGVYYYIFKQDAAAAALKGFVHIFR